MAGSLTYGFRLCLVLAAVLASGEPTQDEIKRKEAELARIRTEIEEYENKIEESESKEKKSLETLDYYEKQTSLIRQLIKQLKGEEKALQKDIDDTRSSIGELGEQLRALKDHYASYVSSVYKYGRMYDLELLFSAKSINQLYVRAEYLKRFSEQRQRDLKKIRTKRSQLQKENATLGQKLKQERKLLEEKTREEKRLSRKMEDRKKILSEIRTDKNSYRKEVARRREAAKELENLITDLIEKERLRKEREAELARARGTAVPDEVIPSAGLFESRKGRLQWPVKSGRLAARFGEQVHPQLKTVTQNTGIDIRVPEGTEVVAIADGDVSRVWWLPSFGSLIILNHNNGYRTVYAQLSEILVGEGQRVGEGDMIAKTGESLTGPSLHFEIWKEREKQDPEVWLRKR